LADRHELPAMRTKKSASPSFVEGKSRQELRMVQITCCQQIGKGGGGRKRKPKAGAICSASACCNRGVVMIYKHLVFHFYAASTACFLFPISGYSAYIFRCFEAAKVQQKFEAATC
jgi:hypothetical protein